MIEISKKQIAEKGGEGSLAKVSCQEITKNGRCQEMNSEWCQPKRWRAEKEAMGGSLEGGSFLDITAL
jgi:hypothetical protein